MKILQKKVIYLGISIGPLKLKLGRYISKIILKISDYIVVRDERSFDFLRSHEINESKIKLTHDLALAIENNFESTFKDNRFNNMSKDFYLGVNLLPFLSAVENNVKLEEKIIKRIAESLNKIFETNQHIKIKLICFQEDPVFNDEAILRRLSKLLYYDSVKIIKYNKNPKVTLKEIESCNGFLGMRLHSTIFAYMTNTPQIILNYHPKCVGFAKAVGYQEKAIVNINNIHVENLYQLLKHLIESPIDFIPSQKVTSTQNEVVEMYKELKRKLV